MEYYVDTDNIEDENFKSFQSLEDAEKYYDDLKVENKILYDEDFRIIKEHNK